LGGRAAEQLVFGEASTGASNDLKRATELARSMVTEFGMSDAVGLVSVARERMYPFLSGPGSAGAGIDGGEKLANTVDAEVRRMVDEAYNAALQLLREHRPALEKLATRLIEVEQLEGEELAELLREERRDQAEGESAA
jgi:cell division protease FtsH